MRSISVASKWAASAVSAARVALALAQSLERLEAATGSVQLLDARPVPGRATIRYRVIHPSQRALETVSIEVDVDGMGPDAVARSVGPAMALLDGVVARSPRAQVMPGVQRKLRSTSRRRDSRQARRASRRVR